MRLPNKGTTIYMIFYLLKGISMFLLIKKFFFTSGQWCQNWNLFNNVYSNHLSQEFIKSKNAGADVLLSEDLKSLTLWIRRNYVKHTLKSKIFERANSHFMKEMFFFFLEKLRQKKCICQILESENSKLLDILILMGWFAKKKMSSK